MKVVSKNFKAFRLPFDLIEKLRQYAFDDRISQQELVITALEEFFKKRELYEGNEKKG